MSCSFHLIYELTLNSTIDEIENDDDFGPHGNPHLLAGTSTARKLSSAIADETEDGKKGKLSGVNRRDSIYPFGAPSESSSEGNDDSMRDRLDALEQSTFRIEKMLARLCANLDELPMGESGDLSGMAALDKSGNQELDD